MLRMPNLLRQFLFASLACCTAPSSVFAQQPAGPVQLPAQFQLNAMEQGYLEQVLSSWQTESAKITIFQCPFERWEYNNAFGPGKDIPLNKNKGDLGYNKPDKGSFQIIEIRVWDPAAKDWVAKQDAIGEHWVCDGENVYEYRHDQKKLIVRPIPPAMRGQAIVDGPLPFLFGADAAKLKARYWLRAEDQPATGNILVQALPKLAADAADYKQVDVMLDRAKMMPKAMQVHMPNGDRHVYMFDVDNATVNGHLQRIMALFQAPRTPWGWQKVLDEIPAAQSPQQPGPGEGRQALEPGATPK
jgi:TIGR03009 family protein